MLLFLIKPPFNPQPGAQGFHVTWKTPVKRETSQPPIGLVEVRRCGGILLLPTADVASVCCCLTSVGVSERPGALTQLLVNGGGGGTSEMLSEQLR